MPITPDEFRRCTRQLASAVSIVTTATDDGQPRGITATAVCPLSWQPPLVLVCIDRSLASYPAFEACKVFSINVLRAEHVSLARRFATRGADKFAAPELTRQEFDL